MTEKVIPIHPYSDFDYALENCKGKIKYGLVAGYNDDGDFVFSSGGCDNGRPIMSRDVLWIAETLKLILLSGECEHD